MLSVACIDGAHSDDLRMHVTAHVATWQGSFMKLVNPVRLSTPTSPVEELPFVWT